MGVHIEERKSQRKIKKVLDKLEKCGILNELSWRG